MQLAVITPEVEFSNEIAIINSLFSNGLMLLHLRRPALDKPAYTRYISGIAPQFHGRVVIHDHFELFDEVGLGGIHLSSYARESEAAWTSIGQIPARYISTSFHAWDEIIANRFPYRYVFISPVFDSISKADYDANIDLTKVREVKEAVKKRGSYMPEVYGLGGVSAGRLADLRKSNFDGAAVLGAIWDSPDPVGNFLEIMTAINSLPAR